MAFIQQNCSYHYSRHGEVLDEGKIYVWWDFVEHLSYPATSLYLHDYIEAAFYIVQRLGGQCKPI